jgi:signal transduction histidine kinase
MSIRLLQNRRMKRIMILVFVAFFIILLSLSALFYRNTLQNFEKSELMRLQGISNSLALLINGDEHERLMMKYTHKDDITNINQDTLYHKIHKLLNANFSANMLKSPIYTLIKSMDGKTYEFGVTSQDKPYFRHQYKSFPPNLLDMYATGGTIPEYTDEFGTWLTAFSTIKNKKDETVALLMVDETLESFLSTARRQALRSIWISMGIFTLMYSLLLYILKEILEKENIDKILLEESNAANEIMKKELQISNEKLTDIDDLRKEMIANISHDLRTPLASVMGYIEMAKDKKDASNEDKKNYLNIAFSEANRLRSMVSDLFELSKLESGQQVLNMEPFNINELVYDVSQKYRLQIEAKHIDLIYELKEGVSLAYGDIKYIDLVFQNLLDNAIKHVYEGGFVKITVAEDDKYIKVKVCNLGDPIEETDRPHLFDRYYKVSSKNGTGLGLAISQKICDLHQCSIQLDVDRKENINSFWFTIPKYLKQ